MGEYSSCLNKKGVLKVIELQLKKKETCVELQWQVTDILLQKFAADFICCQLHTCTWDLN